MSFKPKNKLSLASGILFALSAVVNFFTPTVPGWVVGVALAGVAIGFLTGATSADLNEEPAQ